MIEEFVIGALNKKLLSQNVELLNEDYKNNSVDFSVAINSDKASNKKRKINNCIKKTAENSYSYFNKLQQGKKIGRKQQAKMCLSQAQVLLEEDFSLKNIESAILACEESYRLSLSTALDMKNVDRLYEYLKNIYNSKQEFTIIESVRLAYQLLDHLKLSNQFELLWQLVFSSNQLCMNRFEKWIIEGENVKLVKFIRIKISHIAEPEDHIAYLKVCCLIGENQFDEARVVLSRNSFFYPTQLLKIRLILGQFANYSNITSIGTQEQLIEAKALLITLSDQGYFLASRYLGNLHYWDDRDLALHFYKKALLQGDVYDADSAVEKLRHHFERSVDARIWLEQLLLQVRNFWGEQSSDEENSLKAKRFISKYLQMQNPFRVDNDSILTLLRNISVGHNLPHRLLKLKYDKDTVANTKDIFPKLQF